MAAGGAIVAPLLLVVFPPSPVGAGVDGDVSSLLQNFEVEADDLVTISELGRGAYGVVEKVRHAQSGTIMAVKVRTAHWGLLQWSVRLERAGSSSSRNPVQRPLELIERT